MTDSTRLNNYAPASRPRRLRLHASMRRMVQETRLNPADFIYPLIVRPGSGIRQPIKSMPGQSQLSVDTLVVEVREAASVGVQAVVLFGIPVSKDAYGSDNYDHNGIIPTAIRAVKDAIPEMLVISDKCFCDYTDHGHCGVINIPDDPHYAERSRARCSGRCRLCDG
jgi:porphobilinogen synthase